MTGPKECGMLEMTLVCKYYLKDQMNPTAYISLRMDVASMVQHVDTIIL
jgi:hypothetical protein